MSVAIERPENGHISSDDPEFVDGEFELCGQDHEEGPAVERPDREQLMEQLLILAVTNMSKTHTEPVPAPVPDKKDWQKWALVFAVVCWAASQITTGISWQSAQNVEKTYLKEQVHEIKEENRMLRAYESNLRDKLYNTGVIKPGQLPPLPELPATKD